MSKFFPNESRFVIALIDVLFGALIVLLVIAFLYDTGLAEEEIDSTQVWVLCDPDSYVSIRSGPSKKYTAIGGATCGSTMMTDGVVKKGFLHVYDLAAEDDEGWISTRYIVYSEPEETPYRMEVVADGRVALRKWVGGKIIGWLYSGDVVTVQCMCDEWAVTTRGYVMSEFLIMAGGGDDD